MTELNILDDISIWRSGAEQRRLAAQRRAGLPEGAAVESAAQWRERTAGVTVAEIVADGVRVGLVSVRVDGREGRIEELWLDPAYAGAGHEEAARRWAERWCAEQGASEVGVQLFAPDPVFDDYPVRGQIRLKGVDSPAELPAGVVARPMSATEYPQWRAAGEEQYVFDMVRSGMSREQAKEKSDADYAKLLPQERETPGHAFFVLETADRRIGTGWLHHGHLPGVTFGYSLEVAPEERGNGFGRAAMALGERAAAAAGDSALMFNVFGGNEVAMNLYTGAGFAVLTEYRSKELAG